MGSQSELQSLVSYCQENGLDLYPTADLVPEDSHLRQVFLEHSDYLSLVESDAETCLDVNFPNDLELLTKDGEEASSAAPAAKP